MVSHQSLVMHIMDYFLAGEHQQLVVEQTNQPNDLAGG